MNKESKLSDIPEPFKQNITIQSNTKKERTCCKNDLTDIFFLIIIFILMFDTI